eukprot:5392848-Pleurochrysis_carterae.AAC.2
MIHLDDRCSRGPAMRASSSRNVPNPTDCRSAARARVVHKSFCLDGVVEDPAEYADRHLLVGRHAAVARLHLRQQRQVTSRVRRVLADSVRVGIARELAIVTADARALEKAEV